MIIGIDASRANRKYRSGTEWYSFHLIKNLAHIDSKNQYILYTDTPLVGGLMDLTRFDLEEEKYEKEEVKFDKAGFQIIKSPHNNFKAKVLHWPFSFFWTQGRLSLEMLFKKPDVLFVPAHAIPLVHPKKTVTTVHDVSFEKGKKLFRQEKLGADNEPGRKTINFLVRIFTWNRYGAYSLDYLRWSTRLALKKAKKIIAVSNATKEEILDTYECDRDKIKVVHNGYNNLIYKKIIDPEKEKQVLDKYELKKPYLLYVGRLERKKNTPLFIEAFADARYNNKDFQLNLVLIGNAGYGFDEARYAIKEYDLDSVVFMPGWAEEADMPYIYNGATAFIFPSKKEGFGIPILQAFGCEVPIAASCIPPFREIGQNAILFFNPLDKKEMSEAIKRITLDSELRQTLVKAGRARVSNFSWRKCAQETLQVLEEV